MKRGFGSGRGQSQVIFDRFESSLACETWRQKVFGAIFIAVDAAHGCKYNILSSLLVTGVP